LQDIIIAKHHPTVSRREFLGMTAAASLVLDGRLSGAAEKDSKSGIPYRTLGHTGEKFL
jgi:hypothetical protein